VIRGLKAPPRSGSPTRRGAGGPPLHGEKRHLEIGITLASDPALLLLDEPSAGMSPEETDETMVLIRELARARTVVLVEHKMKLVMGISDRVTVSTCSVLPAISR
jgi:branched-chain amino acid transport system ATP-binding protein